MANFYTDNPDLKNHLSHPLMQKIVDLKERGYSDADKFDYAPRDFEDAMDNYDKVLDIVGDICANTIAPNAESVDHQGPRVENNRVIYADATFENLDACRKAGLMGMAMPRRYGGLNFPITPYIMAADIVSRADTGFENLWGLQDCVETLYEFGNEEQREKFIPRVCEGETMSMDLTEPDAGSDLQSVMLKATQAPDGTWRLNGVKRFITNGDSDIHLVLARSEEGTRDGRGLSMFIYDKRDGGVDVRRIENKMGIKGSPTCELTYKNAKAELCGSRRLGLIKYVMALMNGARLGIAAQSVGVSEIAYREALAYANERQQFGKAIINFPAVYEMLSVMKAKLDASRALLYETSRFVDVYKAYEDIEREGTKLDKEQKDDLKKYRRLADACTPLVKGLASEYCNQNAYDCIQIHGGSGFMKDYACERVYRDARITSIYEGTTQLQVVAAIRHVTTGTYSSMIADYATQPVADELKPVAEMLQGLAAKYNEAIEKVNAVADTTYTDFMARRLVEMAGNLVMSWLLVTDATRYASESMTKSAKVYSKIAQAEVEKHAEFIANFTPDQIELYKQA
ncbi:MAG: acyl-CoA dehydrogenase [Bacteroidales bacterium]|nr:acyl-CoA dehydrogenase [Bacteroidales bacterium]